MIGVLLLTHHQIAAGLLAAVEHTLGKRPGQLALVEADYGRPTEELGAQIAKAVAVLDDGDGVLILSDIFGATHTNLACQIVRRGHIELVSGVNLPMLLKVLNYRTLPLDDLIDKALSGGCGGIVCAGETDLRREARP